MGAGRVILLNGRSSSGKTSIGRALLARLPEPWFLVSADDIGAMRSQARTRTLDDDGLAEVLRRTRLGYHRAVAALASVGNDVIMDYPLSEPWRLEDLLGVLEGYEVTLVEVRCSLPELRRREGARADRPVGLAESQTGVHEHGEHDVVVDTTDLSPEAAADRIVAALAGGGRPSAFRRLRQRS